MKPNVDSQILDLHGVKIPRAWLLQHLLITGTTGSGKSHGIIKPILRQCLAQGDAAVIFDVKGDLLGITQEALARCGRSCDLVTLGTGDGDVTFNPLADQTLSANQIVQQLLLVSSLTGQALSQRAGAEDLFWSSARTELLCAMVELAMQTLAETSEVLNFGHLQKLRRNLSQPANILQRWAADAAELLSENGACSLTEFAHFPDTTRACVLNSATNLISPFLRPPLSLFVAPTPTRPAFNLADLINQSKVLVVTAGHAEQAADLWPAFLLFKQALYRMVLSRPRLKIRQDNHLLVCLDEYTRMMLAHDSLASEHVVMEQARSSKTSFILACQNLSGLEAIGGNVIVDKLAALASNFCFLANSCPATARLAQRVLGTRKTFVRHESVTPLPPPPLLFPEASGPAERTVTSTVIVPVEEPVVTQSELSRLPTGAAYLKLVDGTIHKIQCAFD
jgi:type IV secretory pathway TraG/TraD family ATPase VirD4